MLVAFAAAAMASILNDAWVVVESTDAVPNDEGGNKLLGSCTKWAECEAAATLHNCTMATWNHHVPPHNCHCGFGSKWVDTVNAHCTSACHASLNGCPHQVPTPAPLLLPHWTARTPNSSLPHADLPLIAGVKHTTIFNSTTSTSNGTYNNGPTLTRWNGSFVVSWYNGPKDEGVENRVLFSTSTKGDKWAPPQELFPAVGLGKTAAPKGEENEPWAHVNDRLYAACSDATWGNTHDSGVRGGLLMREVVSLSSSRPGGQAVVLGPMFWLNDVPPAGFESYEIKTYLQMDTQTKADASQYLASLVNQTVELAAGEKFNERSMYAAISPSGPKAPAVPAACAAAAAAARCADGSRAAVEAQLLCTAEVAHVNLLIQIADVARLLVPHTLRAGCRFLHIACLNSRL